jgi:hypothetical protein
MSDKTKTPGSDLFDQAVKNYEQALKTGVRLQEECGKWWTNVLNQTTRPQDWQKNVTAVLNETFPAAEKNMEETLRLMERNSRSSLDLLKQATEAAQSTSFADGQARLENLWQTSLELLQHNAQAMTQANVKLVETWTQLARKSTNGATAGTAR